LPVTACHTAGPVGNLMLAIPLEKLAYIITKAREFDVEVPPVDEDPGSNPSDDAEWDVLQSGADNPTYQELVDAINSLSERERIELLPGSGAATIARRIGAKRSRKPAASTTRKRRITWSGRRCWPTIWKKAYRS